MITLITAVPGSGKSLTLVELIVKELSDKNSSRKIYTNLPLKWSEPDYESGSTQTHLLIDPMGQRVFPLPENDDWQFAEKGSIIIYDEAQKIFPATAKAGAVNDDRLTGLETHRHHGYDIYFVTQDATFVHHHIRKLVGEHIHLYRGSGASTVARYRWSHYVADPNDRREQERADMSVWKFPKALFPLYQSSVEHTHKLKLPSKIKWLGVFLACLICFFGYKFLTMDKSLFFGSDNSEVITDVPAVPASSPLPSSNNAPVSVSDGNNKKELDNFVSTFPDFKRVFVLSTAPPAVPLEGCIDYKDYCQCYDKSGTTLEITPMMCKDLMSKPLPRQIPVGGNNQQPKK